jgi:hypothetical protein
MANPTSNFGWVMPTSTDLVTDLPADFAVFGQAVDTSMADLKGGTTGQVLSKTTNADMDFTWVAQDDSNAIQNALLTTTGDTIYASGASTPARLGVGTTGQVLTVAGGIPSWATPATTSTTWTLLNAGGTALTGGGASTRTVSFSAQNSLLIYVTGASCTAAEQMQYNFNSDAGSNYIEIGNRFSSTGVQTSVGGTNTIFRFGETAAAANTIWSAMYVWGAKGTTEPKGITLTGGGISGGATATFSYAYNGLYTGTSAITSVNVKSNSSAWDAGTVYVYGA